MGVNRGAGVSAAAVTGVSRGAGVSVVAAQEGGGAQDNALQLDGETLQLDGDDLILGSA